MFPILVCNDSVADVDNTFDDDVADNDNMMMLLRTMTM